MNLQENIQRIKEVMGIIFEQIDSNCEEIASKNLKPAQDYWIKWLNDPKTKEKFIINHKIDQNKQKEIYDKYFDVINNINIVYYDKDLNSKGINIDNSKLKSEFKKNQIADAFVLSEYPKTIFFNCNSERLDVLETMTHEIGHLIDYIHPLNPIKQVYNVFSDQMLSYSKKFNMKNLVNSLSKLGVTDPKEIEVIKEKYLKLYNNDQMKWDYVCDLWEKSVNINIMRRLFNLNPGENLTISHLKPYLLLEKELVSDIKWFIYCWIKLGFKDIEEMISNFNSLAKNEYNQKSNLT